MFDAIDAAALELRSLAESSEIEAVVLQGEGKSFCSGLDVTAMLAGGDFAGAVDELLSKRAGDLANFAQRVPTTGRPSRPGDRGAPRQRARWRPADLAPPTFASQRPTPSSPSPRCAGPDPRHGAHHLAAAAHRHRSRQGAHVDGRVISVRRPPPSDRHAHRGGCIRRGARARWEIAQKSPMAIRRAKRPLRRGVGGQRRAAPRHRGAAAARDP